MLRVIGIADQGSGAVSLFGPLLARCAFVAAISSSPDWILVRSWSPRLQHTCQTAHKTVFLSQAISDLLQVFLPGSSSVRLSFIGCARHQCRVLLGCAGSHHPSSMHWAAGLAVHQDPPTRAGRRLFCRKIAWCCQREPSSMRAS